MLKNANPKIEYYSRFSPSPLSIKQFLDFGKSHSDSSWRTDRKNGIVYILLHRDGILIETEMSQFGSSVLLIVELPYKLL